jgi:3',5'-cyclic-nucleotide phosphodiesterase
MKIKYILLFFFTILLITDSWAQEISKSFTIIPLGVKGGLDESNLSAYLVSAAGDNRFICLDAGTINFGLQKAVTNKLLQSPSAEKAQQDFIKDYFISHAHLDHTAGLILNSPNDNAKNIYGFESVLAILKNNYFTWRSWANFGSEGDKPILNKYTYTTLTPNKEITASNTDLQVTPFLLSHVNPYESSAFLIRNKNKYLLYLGDTGADTVEKSKQLESLWKSVAPLVQKGDLKAIMIEVSFSNQVPEKALFGHLTPTLLMSELAKLNTLSTNSLQTTSIIVTHIKPCDNCETQIKKELSEANKLGLKLIYTQQGEEIQL